MVEVNAEKIKEYIGADTAYACAYWPSHVMKSGQKLRDHDTVYQFLEQHFLYWLEALSRLGRLSEAIDHLGQLKSHIDPVHGAQTRELLTDTKRFVLAHWYAIDLAPLQLYYSALVFTPTESVVRSAFAREMPREFSLLPQVSRVWGAERHKLEYVGETVKAIALSLVVKTAVIACSDKLYTYDATNGEKIQGPVFVDEEVSVVAFSPDETGAVQQDIGKHNDRVTTVAFASNGKQLASACDTTVNVWDLETGDRVQEYHQESSVGTVAWAPIGERLAIPFSKGVKIVIPASAVAERLLKHDGVVAAVAFSPDGELLATASIDGTVRLSAVVNGAEKRLLKGHDDAVVSVAFARDGKHLATASHDWTVRVWDVARGEVLLALEHEDRARAVAFASWHDNVLISASYDNTVRAWDIAGTTTAQELEGHTDRVSMVVFSRDRKLLATSSSDRTIRLYGTLTTKLIRVLEAGDSVVSITFSDDGKLLASAEDNGTICIWNVHTGLEEERVDAHRSCRSLRFNATAQTLDTDGEQFSLKCDLADVQHSTGHDATSNLDKKEDWVQLSGEDVLWLPRAYGGHVYAAEGETLVIGQELGGVSWFKTA